MRTRALLAAATVALMLAAPGQAAVQDAGDAYILGGPALQAEVVKATGVIRALETGGTRWSGPGFGRLWLYPPLPHKYGGETSTPLKQEQGQAEVTVAGESVQVKWKTELGELTQIISVFGPALVVRYDLQLRAAAWGAIFKCVPALSEEQRNQAKFLPDGTALTQVYRTAPSYGILQCPGFDAGLGLIVPAGGDNDYLVLSGGGMDVQIRPLHFEKQQRYAGVFALCVPRTLPEVLPVWDAVEKQGGAARPVAQIVRLQADKLIYPPHSAGQIGATLRSLSAKPEDVNVEFVAHRGLGESEALGVRAIRLEPLAQVQVSVPWQLGEQAWGIGLEARLKQGESGSSVGPI